MSGSYDFYPAPNVPAPAFLNQTEWAAVYMQDQISMANDRLHILIGGRYDRIKQIQNLPGYSTISDSAFTARGGILYETTEWMAPYASISQSFRPQFPNTVDQEGNPLDPETGLQYETTSANLDYL